MFDEYNKGFYNMYASEKFITFIEPFRLRILKRYQLDFYRKENSQNLNNLNRSNSHKNYSNNLLLV
jgi:hypothetical protein